MTDVTTDSLFAPRTPVTILGVPFDVVTGIEATSLIERMIGSRRPHYVVTPNVDFLVQATEDIELRRILIEAHLVVCDGAPLVWASRLLGNPLPERVAGADLAPLLIQLAAKKKYRLFFLGATETSSSRAVARLREDYPELIIAGHYSPPFNDLLEMDHAQIQEQISAARADILFVSFGCPKQEKWMAMHYRTLGVPVTIGVGGTIDFLAGQVKRAPLWMQRAGAEWLFRLVQEPHRLFRRYRKDLWVFSRGFMTQWWGLKQAFYLNGQQRLLPNNASGELERASKAHPDSSGNYHWIYLPVRLDFLETHRSTWATCELKTIDKPCFLDASKVAFVDSTGVGFLIQWQKRIRAAGHCMVLIAPSSILRRALSLLRLNDFFFVADSPAQAWELVSSRSNQLLVSSPTGPLDDKVRAAGSSLEWHGEVTAANAAQFWEKTVSLLNGTTRSTAWQIDLFHVRFIDSSGLGLMLRLKKLARGQDKPLSFSRLQPAVFNVIKLAGLVEFLLGTSAPPECTRQRALST